MGTPYSQVELERGASNLATGGEGNTRSTSGSGVQEASEGYTNDKGGKKEKRGEYTTKTCMQPVSKRKNIEIYCGAQLEDWELRKFKRCGGHRAKGNAAKQRSNAKKLREKMENQVCFVCAVRSRAI